MLSVYKGLLLLSGNIFKHLCYIYQYFFPKKRFTIPPHAQPLKKAKYEQKIPRIIWQTNFTDKFTLPVYFNYWVNRHMSPTYEHRFVSTEARAEFIKENYPQDIYDAYSRIQIGAAQADFWRVLVLYKYGGVYLDIDATTVVSLDKLIKPEDTEKFLKLKDGRICNSFIAAAPNNPIIGKIIEQIKRNIEENTIGGVFDMTGPGVFNKLLDSGKVNTFHYKSCFQGGFTNEYFQYIDKAEGKWTKQQNTTPVVRKD